MKNAKRRVLGIILTLAVLAAIIPSYAFALDATESGTSTQVTTPSDTDPVATPTPGITTPTDTKPSTSTSKEDDDDDVVVVAPTPAPVVPTPTPAAARPAGTTVVRPAATATPAPVQPVDGKVVVSTQVGAAVSEGTATVVVSSAVLSQSVDEAIASAGNAAEAAAPVVEISMLDSQDATAICVTLPTDSLARLAENTEAKLTLTSDVAQVSFDATSLAAIAGQAGEEVVLVVTPAAEDLNEAQKSAVGERPVFDLTLQSGDTLVSDFNNGTVTVSIPYVLAEGEEAEGVVVWYVDDLGNITPCTTTYDAETSQVIFETTHFSKYVIGYEAPAVEEVSVQPESAVSVEPQEEASSFPVVPVILVCAAVVIVLAVVLFKRSAVHKG